MGGTVSDTDPSTQEAQTKKKCFKKVNCFMFLWYKQY